jgi:hypothetical protein
MSQVDLLNRLLPSIPELNEILMKIRKKYLIEKVLPENEQLAEIILQQRTIEEWEAIRQDIENELRAWIQPVTSRHSRFFAFLLLKLSLYYIYANLHLHATWNQRQRTKAGPHGGLAKSV